jgi:hypothetical protein
MYQCHRCWYLILKQVLFTTCYHALVDLIHETLI